jgi:hypothetical protein
LGCLVAVGVSGQPTIPTCVSGGTLASYEALANGCIVGDKIFSSFTYHNSGNVLADTAITVIPQNADKSPADLPGYGLGFEASWAVGVNQTEDSLIGFQVTIVPGSAFLIEDDTLSVPSYLVATGGILTSITESVCLGGSWVSGACIAPGVVESPVLHIPCSAQAGSTCTDTSLNLTMNVGPFGPYSTLGVSKDISLIGGWNCPTGNCAAFSEVYQNFSQVAVPEPAAVLLFGTCLLALFPVLRKHLSR